MKKIYYSYIDAVAGRSFIRLTFFWWKKKYIYRTKGENELKIEAGTEGKKKYCKT